MLILTELDSNGHPIMDHGVVKSLNTFYDTLENRVLFKTQMNTLAARNSGINYAIVEMVPKILYRTGEPTQPC